MERATVFLDCVVSANAYVPAVPELREAAMRCRRIGLGIMGLADVLFAAGLGYNTDAGREFAAEIMSFVHTRTAKTSVKMARRIAPFPAFRGSRFDSDRSPFSPEFQGRVRACGLRNAALNTIAPTGSLATVAGCEGYGCEPVFALAYKRYLVDNRGAGRREMRYVSPAFARAVRSWADGDAAKAERVLAAVAVTGSCQDVEDLPPSVRAVFVTSSDISWTDHVAMQAALQAHVDNSISKTINMPNAATVEDVEEAYRMAWREGCKGLTVYRTGSRDVVVLETKATAAGASALRDRPGALRGATMRVECSFGTVYVTVNEDEAGEPFEVFVHVGKSGTDMCADAEAVGRLVSLALRLNCAPVSPKDRLRSAMDQLRGLGGSSPVGRGPSRVSSMPDAVAHAIRTYLGDAPPEHAGAGALQRVRTGDKDVCPSCHNATLVKREGCASCTGCGFSRC